MRRRIRAITVFATILLIAWVGGLGIGRMAAYALTYALVYAWCAYILSID